VAGRRKVRNCRHTGSVAGDRPGEAAQGPGEHEGEDLPAQRVSAGGDAYVAGRDMHVHLLPGGDGRLLAAAGLPDDLESPYKGLDAFRVKDAGLFFGRDREAEDILGRLAADGLLIVSGVSGAGKSSLLRAGVRGATLRRAAPGADADRHAARRAGERRGRADRHRGPSGRGRPAGRRRSASRRWRGRLPRWRCGRRARTGRY
jgi:hypothetical protein